MTSLKEVHETFQKWMHLDDLGRIDIMLAVAISRVLKGTKLWLIFIGNSGDGKTEQLRALEGSSIKFIREFTSKTLVSGSPSVQDLAPRLRNQILCIPDMAQLLKLHPNEKSSVWAQLRNLYDGYAGKQSGAGKDVDYSDLNVTLIAGSTPAIDNQLTIFQELGTRELIYRTTEEDVFEEEKIMDKIKTNLNDEKKMRQELNSVVVDFVKKKEALLRQNYHKIEISDDIDEELRMLSRLLTYMRASATSDRYTQEPINFASRERPTRIYKQLRRLFVCLRCLDKGYKDKMALRIIRKVIEDSSDLVRIRVMKKMLEIALEKDVSISQIARELKIGKAITKREIYILWNLGLIDQTVYNEGEYSWGKLTERYKWIVNKDHFLVKNLFLDESKEKRQKQEELKK